MNKRAIAAASLIAALSLGSLAVGAAAQEPAAADSSATSKTAAGIVSEVDHTYYLTPDGGEPIELSYGPSWLWGNASPLQLLVGMEVTVVGQLRDGAPNDNASEMAQAQAADKMPVMQVRSIVGMELREQGKPPWAGGPKDVGEAHPGFEGWSEGQAEKAAKAEERAADKAARAVEKAAKAEERAADKAARAVEKAAKAEERAADKAARAEEKAAKAEERAADKAAKAAERGNRP